jgi:ABC-type oligopeptide transport system substrate-binding subunit
MRRIVCVIGLVLASVSVTAQSTICDADCVVSVGQQFVAFVEADPAITDYGLFANGQSTGIVPSIVNGLVEFAHPGYTETGTVSLVVMARSGGVTFQYSDALSLTVVRRKIKIRR